MTTTFDKHMPDRILRPVAAEIEMVREATDGIVFVVHRPGKNAQAAMAKLGAEVRRKGTTVFGMSCTDATAAVGHDLVTRRWAAAPPLEGQIKVFLIAGESTGLLTLNFIDGRIQIVKEPDIFPVA